MDAVASRGYSVGEGPAGNGVHLFQFSARPKRTTNNSKLHSFHIYPPPSVKFTISPLPPPSYVPGWAHAVAGTGSVGPA